MRRSSSFRRPTDRPILSPVADLLSSQERAPRLWRGCGADSVAERGLTSMYDMQKPALLLQLKRPVYQRNALVVRAT